MNESATSPSVELLAQERHAEIRRRLSRSGRVLATEIAQEFNVSADTARRDLRDLAAAGHCVRVYGGALPVPAVNTPLHERFGINTDRKRELAKRMLSLVKPGMMLFLDAGSTNLALANLLPETLNLTIATNAPHIAAALVDRPSLKLFVIGGPIDQSVGAAIGAQAQRELARLNPDIAFIGACAVDGKSGATAFEVDDAEFKRQLAERSTIKLIAAVNDKIGTAALYPILPLNAFDYVVVERTLEPARKASLKISTSALLSA
jgi:DeoR/GlpR family transcriptional regulator of sugar metabolism